MSVVLIIAFADRFDQRTKFGVENEFNPLQAEQYMYIAYHNVINTSNSLNCIIYILRNIGGEINRDEKNTKRVLGIPFHSYNVRKQKSIM